MSNLRNDRGYKEQIFQMQKNLDFVQGWPTTEKGLQDFAEYSKKTFGEDLTQEALKHHSFRKMEVGDFRFYTITQDSEAKFYYFGLREADCEPVLNVTRENRDEILKTDLSRFFLKLREERALVRVGTYNSDRWGSPWGIVGRIGLDRVYIELASRAWPDRVEIRFHDLLGPTIVWGDADVVPSEWGGIELPRERSVK